MATDLVQSLTVNTGYVAIKFAKSLRVDSIGNDNFEVEDIDSTPIAIVDPFQTIDIEEDYDSIGRELTLYWASGKLTANTAYRLTITGLIDVADNVVDDEVYTFTTGDNIAPEEDELPPEAIPVTIEDHSIRSDVFSSSDSIIAANPNFYIESTDPLNGEFLVESDYNNGRVTIIFSEAPHSSYINTTYFKGQRKKIQRAPIRWENLEVEISTSTNEVYVDFPSDDATPVYYTDGKEYFEAGYKYRVKVSKNVGDE